MVIYADILIAVNWWIDFLLLLGVQRLLGVRTPPWRLIVGALLGAVSCSVLFLPPLSAWLSLLIKFSAAAMMVLVTFGWHSARRFGRASLLLFGLSAALSGVSAALYYFAAPRGFYVFNGVVYYAVSPWLLVGLTLLCYSVLWVIERVSARRAPLGHSFVLRISHEGKLVQVRCLYDSGNHLVEPFSNCPVLVVERAVLDELLLIPPSTEEIPPNGKWRVVPFDTLGGNGLLPAFFADRVTAITPRGERDLRDCYVAVCERLGRGEYDGLIGSALGDQLVE